MKTESAALFGWVSGCVVALTVVLLPSLWTIPNILNLLTALATIAAAVVALWIAGESQREKQVEALKHAQLIAAGITLHISEFKQLAVVNHVRLIQREMEPATQEEIERAFLNHQTIFLSLIMLMDHPVVRYELSIIGALMPLHRNVAGHLNSICGVAQNIRRDLAVLKEDDRWEVLNLETRAEWLNKWSPRIGFIIRHLDLIEETIAQAASIGAPPLTLEELFNS